MLLGASWRQGSPEAGSTAPGAGAAVGEASLQGRGGPPPVAAFFSKAKIPNTPRKMAWGRAGMKKGRALEGDGQKLQYRWCQGTLGERPGRVGSEVIVSGYCLG